MVGLSATALSKGSNMKELNIQTIVDKFENLSVGVIGDLILDSYIWGNANRISPEAPVPVVHVNRKNHALGGAANVINNICCLGAKCRAYGVVGNDKNGKELTEMTKDLGSAVDGIIADGTRCTTVKTRVLAGNQQIVRIDEEDTHFLSNDVKQLLIDKVKADIDNGLIQGLIFEDYAKGVLDPAMVQNLADYARANGVLTAMDPHPRHNMNIKNLTFITPNRMEAFAMAGEYFKEGLLPITDDAPLMKVGEILSANWSPDMLLITLGAHGMSLFRKEQNVFHIPTLAKAVFDVSGAGDTVIATLMLSLLADCNGEEAARVANRAAGVVVGCVGTVPIQQDQLVESFAN